MPVSGPEAAHRSLCAWRLNTTVDAALREVLDTHLPAGVEYHARFELRNASLLNSKETPLSIVSRRAAYRFALTDADGKRVVDRLAVITDPVIKSRLLRTAMVVSPELYQPFIVFELFFDIVDQVAASIDAAALLPPAVHVAQK